MVSQKKKEEITLKRGLKAIGVLGILVCILYSPSLFARGPDTLWIRTYSGSGGDVGNSVQEISEGGYIIAGYTNSFGAGSIDVYFIRVAINGDTLWTRTYGRSDGEAG
jgi:hypothetical protein